MKMKFIIFFLVMFSLNIFSQDRQEKREQIKALKVSYLTTELNLNSEESEKFWPVYNTYDNKVYEIRHNKMKPLIKKIKAGGIDKLNEKEATSYLNQFEAADEELFNLRKKLVTDLKPVIGAIKLLKLKRAEEDFNKKLLSQYKGKKK